MTISKYAPLRFQRAIAHFALSVPEARTFLTHVRDGKLTVANTTRWHLEYEITEQGPAFTLYAQGGRRAYRRFPLTWTMAGSAWAGALLAALDGA